MFANILPQRRSTNATTVPHKPTSGFTLIEMMVVVAILGILTAIAAPSWLTFFNMRKLDAAQDQIYQTMRLAQIEAKRSHTIRQANFREVNGAIQWAISSSAAPPTAAQWQTLATGVQIDSQETTLAQANGLYRVQFDERGNINGQLGRLTVGDRNGGRGKRCVITSTLVGAIRKGSNQTRPDQTGRFCY